jgi:hypothetical protein
MWGSFKMKRIIMALVLVFTCLLAAHAWAQTSMSGSIVRWEKATYAKNSHTTKNQIVYTVRVGNATYKIARKSDKVDLQAGEQVQCEVGKTHIKIIDQKGKERRYDIVGSEASTMSPTY